MSLNRYRPHLFILPEDDADRQIANGFILHPNLNQRVIQVLAEAGGWQDVIDQFNKEHVREMEQFPEERMLLLIDFDERLQDRLNYFKARIPEKLQARVFILGVFSEPEKLRNDVGKSFEAIGETLANNCADNTSGLWEHNLLQHNKTELERMTQLIKPFLFS